MTERHENNIEMPSLPVEEKRWTEDQLRAIETVDRTLLLSAAAGSGKTATLTERLVRRITAREDALDVSRMLVVTFTRAAAAELRARIAKALTDALARDPENQALARQLLLLPSAKIRTIDSFCNDLVKGHTEALDISPAYRIPDEAENAVLAAGLMEQLIEDAYSAVFVPRGAGIAQVSECTVGAKNERELSALLLSFYEKLRSYPEGPALLETFAERMARERTLPYFDTLWGGYVKELTRTRLTDLKKAYGCAIAAAEAADGADSLVFRSLGASFAYDLAFLEETIGGLDEGYTATRRRLLSFSTPAAAGNAPDGKLSEESLYAKQFRKTAKARIEKWSNELYAWREEDIPAGMAETEALVWTIADLLMEFHKRYLQEKRRLSLCDYNDLSHFALALLYDGDKKTPLAEQLTEAFDAVCIDEYQDVNEVQHRIFSAISTKTDRFMVGDIKQSIYGFRGAEPNIFAALRRDYAQNAPTEADGTPSPTVYFLRANFRSEPAVLTLCNEVFDFLFGVLGDSIGYSAAQDHLNPGRAPSSGVPLPELTVLPKSKSSTSEEEDEEETEAPPEEVAEVTARICRLLREEAHPDGRPYLPSDIAILLRSGKKKIASFVGALQAAGIPVCTEDKENFFTHPEILLALCLCHAVNNPHRDIYLAGLLRSPLYGFSMDELIILRRAHPNGTLYDALCAYAAAHPEAEKHRAFLHTLASFREIAEGMATEKLLRRLFEETGLFAVVDAAGRHLLYSFYEYARRYEGAAYHGLFRFLSHIDKLIAQERTIGDGRMVGEKNGVQIMTVHHSKGLEFPVCFLCGLGSGFSTQDTRSALPFTPALGLGLKLRDRETGLARIKTPITAAISAAIKRTGREEEARVLYVALTRAKERLYMYGTAGKKLSDLLSDCALAHAYPTATGLLEQNAFLPWLLSALGPNAVCCRVRVLEAASEAVAREETKAEPVTQAAEEGSGTRTEELIACLRERFGESYPHALATTLPGKLSVSVLDPAFLDQEDKDVTHLAPQAYVSEADAEETFQPTVPAFISGVQKNAAALAGTATHVFLQFFRFGALGRFLTAEAAVDGELARMQRERFMPAEEIARVRREEVARFLSSPVTDRIVDARRVYRELRFHNVLPASTFTQQQKELYERYSILVQGVIDLVFEDRDGRLVLLDYKTDRLTREELADPERAKETLLARYSVQLSCYALAVERIFGRAPDEVLIYSLHAGRAFPLEKSLF